MKAKFFLLSLLIAAYATAQTVSDFVSIPNPDDLEVDRFGNVWVNYRVSLSSNEHRLAKISTEGTITDVIIENHTLGQFGINDTIIWIAGEWGPDAFVFKYDHNGNRLDSIYMPYPTAIILDPDGTWFVTQNALGRLTKVNPDKTTQTLASGSPLSYNLALARDENGMFYTCNLLNALVIRIDPATGAKTTLATLPTANPYSLGFLSYSHGKLYVPSFRHCIYEVDTSGFGFTVFAGTEMLAGDQNGSVSEALLYIPIATHPSLTGDTLYFTDSGNGKIRMISGLTSASQTMDSQSLDSMFKVFPNPANEVLNITFRSQNETIAKIDFVTVDGKTMKSVTFAENVNQEPYIIALNGLPDGSYLLRITTSKGKIVNKNIVKS